jgi:hypothetical protein
LGESRLGLLSGWCRRSLFVARFLNDRARVCLAVIRSSEGFGASGQASDLAQPVTLTQARLFVDDFHRSITGAAEGLVPSERGQAEKIAFQAATSRYRKTLTNRVCTSRLSRRAPIVLIAQTCQTTSGEIRVSTRSKSRARKASAVRRYAIASGWSCVTKERV